MITLKILPSFNVEIIQLEKEKVKCSMITKMLGLSVCWLTHRTHLCVNFVLRILQPRALTDWS